MVHSLCLALQDKKRRARRKIVATAEPPCINQFGCVIPALEKRTGTKKTQSKRKETEALTPRATNPLLQFVIGAENIIVSRKAVTAPIIRSFPIRMCPE
jgi:hypothetical protein